jgi:LmbE family N-acetylglucosaminyl deacetylase
MPGPRLLACFAHPDDEAFPVGGALAAHAARGVVVGLVTATLGEEGEIRQPDSATAETLASVRRAELACSARTLGLTDPIVLSYRDSGMAGTPSNRYPNAFINAPAEEVVERLVGEIRRFRPQVVLTFEPGGLYGHPDHIAISRHATQAFQQAGDPTAFPHQLNGGSQTHSPDRLFYSARPVGFRMDWALKLRDAGLDVPLPSPERAAEGTPAGEIHLEMDLTEQLEAKMACIRCHRTQMAPDWPYDRVSREVSAAILGREYYIRAWPTVQAGEKVPADFFQGLDLTPGD